MMEEVDLVVRISAATTALLVLAGLWREARDQRLVWYFGLFVLGLCGFLAGNTPSSDFKPDGPLGAVLPLLSSYNAIFLWWFILALFDDDFRPGLLEGGIGALWFVIAAANRGYLGAGFEAVPLNTCLLIMATGIVCHMIWRLWSDQEGDLVPARQRARGILVVAITGLLGIDVVIDVVAGTVWKPPALTLAYNMAILGILIWLAGLLTRTQLAPLRFDAPSQQEFVPQVTTEQVSESVELARIIQRLIKDEHIHLETELTFAQFVKKTGCAEQEVRQYINHVLGHRHFRAFLNAHRVAEARRLLQNPERQQDKISSIAFDSGFASLASFHRAFSAIEGMTPSDYRNQ